MFLNRPAGDWALLAILALLFSSAVLMTKIVVATIPPITTVAIRLLIAIGVLYGLMRHNGQSLPPVTVPGRPGQRQISHAWMAFAVLGLLGNAIPFSLMSIGQTRIDAGVAGILLAFMPLATIVLAHFFVRDDKLTFAKFVGFCIGFLGLFVLFDPLGGGVSATHQTLIYHFAVLCAALCYALNTIVARRMPEVDPIAGACAITICAFLLTVPVMILADNPMEISTNVPALILLVALGVFPTGLATIYYLMLIRSAGPSFLSLTNYIVPIITVALSALLLGESFGLSSLLALALILTGIAVSQWRAGTVREPSPPNHG